MTTNETMYNMKPFLLTKASWIDGLPGLRKELLLIPGLLPIYEFLCASRNIPSKQEGIAGPCSHKFDYLIYVIRLYTIMSYFVLTPGAAEYTFMDDLVTFLSIISNSDRPH
jgi:hypothetical protein